MFVYICDDMSHVVIIFTELELLIKTSLISGYGLASSSVQIVLHESHRYYGDNTGSAPQSYTNLLHLV